MAKSLSEMSLFDILPDSISNIDEVRRGAAAIDPELKSVSLATQEALLLSRIDELSEDTIDLLAWQFHLDVYEPIPLPLGIKRQLIKSAISWHRKKGTKWAVSELLSTLGYDCELFEYKDLIAASEKAGVKFLDGTWDIALDNGVDIFAPIEGFPDLANWACFAVKTNLTASDHPNWPDDLRWAVNTAKPARSCALYWYWIYMHFFVKILAKTTRLYMKKETRVCYPWCYSLIDPFEPWYLGEDGMPYALGDNGLYLDGTWCLGDGSDPIYNRYIYNCGFFIELSTVKQIRLRLGSAEAIAPGEPTPLCVGDEWWLDEFNAFVLRSAKMMHKGVNLGLQLSMSAGSASYYSIMFGHNATYLDDFYYLDGRWNITVDSNIAIGDLQRGIYLDGTWDIANEGTYSINGERLFAKASIIPLRGPLLGDRCDRYIGDMFCLDLDGTWDIADEYFLGDELYLDGSWSLGAGFHLGDDDRNYIDGSWDICDETLYLDGTWNIGDPMPECYGVVEIHKI